MKRRLLRVWSYVGLVDLQMAGVDWGIEMFKVVDTWTIDRHGLVCGVDWGYRDVAGS